MAAAAKVFLPLFARAPFLKSEAFTSGHLGSKFRELVTCLIEILPCYRILVQMLRCTHVNRVLQHSRVAISVYLNEIKENKPDLAAAAKVFLPLSHRGFSPIRKRPPP